MLSGLMKFNSGLFAEPKCEPRPIFLYPEAGISILTVFNYEDRDDACMKALIDSFSMHEADESWSGVNKSYALFTLKDTTQVELSYYIKPNFLRAYCKDDVYVMTKCAAESILRKLFSAKLLHNNTVAFSSTKNDSDQDAITTKLRMKMYATGEPDKENDTVSFVTAQLDVKEIRIYFNNLTAYQRIHIKDELSKSFIDRTLAPRLTGIIIAK